MAAAAHLAGRLVEIGSVGWNLKAQQIVAQKAFHQLIGVGESAQQLLIRPGHMPKLHQGQQRVGPAQNWRHQGQVEVLQKYQGRTIAGLLQHGLSEALIHQPIGVPVLRIAQGRHEGHMAEGPEAAVGQIVVVAIALGIAQPDTPQPITGLVGGYRHTVAGIDATAIGRATAMGDPGAPTGLRQRLQGRNHAAGGPLRHHRPIATAVDPGLPVGGQDQWQIPQPLADQGLQTAAVPGGGHARH